MTADLYWLTLTALVTAVMAVPYVTERILRVGFFSALGYSRESGTGGFDQPVEKPGCLGEAGARRPPQCCRKFADLATLVLVAHLLPGIDAGLVATAAKSYFFARLLHYVVYAAGIPVIRTLAFFVALASIFAIGYAVLTAVGTA